MVEGALFIFQLEFGLLSSINSLSFSWRVEAIGSTVSSLRVTENAPARRTLTPPLSLTENSRLQDAGPLFFQFPVPQARFQFLRIVQQK